MSFVFQLNKAPTNFVGAYMFLWQTMVNAGWTVLSWSDGSTAHGPPGAGFLGFTTASDGTPNHAGGAGSANNTNAWILLQQPPATGGAAAPPYGGFRQLTWQRGTSTSVWRLKYSHSGAYTNPASPGTAAATPVQNATLADEVILMGGGTDAAPTFQTMFNNTFEGVMHVHSAADNGLGPASPYGWYMVCVPNGLGASVQTAIIFDPVMSGTAAPGDVDPFVFYSDNNSGEVIFGYGTNQSWSTDTSGGIFSPHGWLRKGQSGAGFVGMSALYAVGNGSSFSTPFVAGATTSTNISFASNHVMGIDDIYPFPYARRSNQSSPTGYKGFSSMVRNQANRRLTGDTLSLNPATNTRDRFVVNNVSLPWDGVTVPIV